MLTLASRDVPRKALFTGLVCFPLPVAIKCLDFATTKGVLIGGGHFLKQFLMSAWVYLIIPQVLLQHVEIALIRDCLKVCCRSIRCWALL